MSLRSYNSTLVGSEPGPTFKPEVESRELCLRVVRRLLVWDIYFNGLERHLIPEFNSDMFLGLELLNSVTGLVTSFINLVIAFVALIRHQEIKTLA
ncbi:hypothetical protein TWF970_001934 [Orbilia oligospora]|uniref:Uncharacterized protein n=1 Tax=Orbilia oligospora TaxID=2813651 RepID=A0A7C8VHM4_ORBOL|nr:hypothetical protein TWF970_001934 [Orbilia oligospora]